MTEQHECKFWWNEDKADVVDNPFVCECGKSIDAIEALDRINATERLSVELVREELGCYSPGWTGWDKLRIAAWEYADILEGKPRVARSFNETGADADFRVESKNNMEGEDD